MLSAAAGPRPLGATACKGRPLLWLIGRSACGAPRVQLVGSPVPEMLRGLQGSAGARRFEGSRAVLGSVCAQPRLDWTGLRGRHSPRKFQRSATTAIKS